MSQKAYITPSVLKWARETARMTEETAAAKIPVPVEKLREWEAGTSQPTIKQAQILAKAYRRPFAIFFLPDIPLDFQPIQDFRRPGSKPLTTSSIFIIREIQQKQSWISDFFKENKEKKLSFVGKYSIKDDPQLVASDILNTLKVTPAKYDTDPIKEWIKTAELNGIFISRTSFIHSRLKIDPDELKGFAIADPYAPFVFINSDDWNAAQLFTLVHELAHIWIAKTGISNEIIPEKTAQFRIHPVEKFCNEVAANALMPKELFLDFDSKLFTDLKKTYQIAKQFGVSLLALLIRAHTLGILSDMEYQKFKIQAETEFRDYLKKEEEKKTKQRKKKNGPSYYLLQLNRNGRLFTQTVLDSFRGGLIEPTLASHLLNVQVNKFSKLESYLY